MEHGRIGEVFNFGVLHMEWPTALFIFVVFVITMFLLNVLLFKPILQTLEVRAAESGKGIDLLKQIEQDRGKLEEEYQSKMDRSRDELLSHREKIIGEAHRELEIIVGRSKKESAESLARAEEILSTEYQTAMDEVIPIAKTLAETVCSKVLKS